MSSIHIRPLLEFDAEAHFDAVLESKAELAPWLPWCHPKYSIADSREWIALQEKAFVAKREYAFGIFDGNDLLLGGCGLNRVLEYDRVANLGYWVRIRYTKRGIASVAIRQLVTWAFENTLFERLEVIASTLNLPSQKAAENAGASREGILRSRVMLGGSSHDCVVYSFIRRDHKPA